MLAGAAVVYAVGQSEAPTEGAGDTYLSPALPTYQPAALFPLKETGETFSRGGVLKDSLTTDAGGSQWGAGPPATLRTFRMVEHDPLWAYVLDPGFQLPTPAPPPSPVVRAAGALTEAQLREVLTLAGWPVELHDQAVAIVHCESRFRPDALGDGGRSGGLFQLNIATWFRYAGEDANLWHDPYVNARTAWATYQYDIGRGYEPWKQWSCRKVLY